MDKNKKWVPQWSFSDGHPQSYHIAAVMLAVVALGIAVTTRIFAENSNEDQTENIVTIPSTAIRSCSYSYSSWGACQSNGKHTRTVTGKTPSGCVQTTNPTTEESCTYTAPVTVCSYSYSSWGACQSNGKHTRTITGTSPSGCSQTTNPSLEESCMYTPPACVYNYSAWGACQSEGRHYRTVTGKTPNDCEETTNPVTSENCVYTVPSLTTAVQCSFTYSDWGICQPNGQQTRVLRSKSPVDCAESTHPVLNQSCTYTNNNVSLGESSSSSSTAVQCVYAYSSWGVCQSNGQQTRALLSALPNGCVQRTYPTLSQPCTYTNNSTSSGQGSGVTPIQCAYSYSDWGICQENGKRVRTIVSKTPENCEEYTRPVVEQSCIYESNPTANVETSPSSSPIISTTNENTSNNVMPAFSFVNVGEGMTVRGESEIKGEVQGAQGVEFYLVPVGSNTYKYIGTASRASGTDTQWRLAFHSDEFPNGEFYLRAKVKNSYGEYGSGQRKIFIANGNQVLVQVAVTQEGFTTLGANEEEKKKTLDQFKQDIQLDQGATAGETRNLDQERKRILDHCEENPEKCFPERDSDNDGLSDIDEIRYGTDPHSADTDLDGFTDGDEVKNGFDPLKYSGGDQSDRIVFEDPKVTGEVKKETYVVQNVELKEKEAGGKGLHLTGKGLPNSFVTIYIYSDPIVLTVKTDSDGNWTYELDKDLENGDHQVYVAVTDNTGKITAKSEPLAFVKTAEAATIIPSASAAGQTQTKSVTQSRSTKDLFFLLSIIIAALAVAMASIGFIKHRSSEI